MRPKAGQRNVLRTVLAVFRRMGRGFRAVKIPHSPANMTSSRGEPFEGFPSSPKKKKKVRSGQVR